MSLEQWGKFPVSISEPLRAALHCHSSFPCMVFAHYWGIFMQKLDFFFCCAFWSLPDHVNSCVLQPIPASALQCLVKSLLVLIPKQFSSWFFQNCPHRQSWQMSKFKLRLNLNRHENEGKDLIIKPWKYFYLKIEFRMFMILSGLAKAFSVFLPFKIILLCPQKYLKSQVSNPWQFKFSSSCDSH